MLRRARGRPSRIVGWAEDHVTTITANTRRPIDHRDGPEWRVAMSCVLSAYVENHQYRDGFRRGVRPLALRNGYGVFNARRSGTLSCRERERGRLCPLVVPQRCRHGAHTDDLSFSSSFQSSLRRDRPDKRDSELQRGLSAAPSSMDRMARPMEPSSNVAAGPPRSPGPGRHSRASSIVLDSDSSAALWIPP